MRFSLLFLLLFSLHADPFGKDSDLVQPKINTPSPPQTIVQKIASSMIRFHQEVISPADGPRSHFKPSSSQYTMEAINRYGFIRGFQMGCDRLQRENKEEWVYRKTVDGAGVEIKYDPVR